MNILEIVHDFPPNSFAGTELYTLSLSKALRRLGHEVTVLYPVRTGHRGGVSVTVDSYEGVPTIQVHIGDEVTLDFRSTTHLDRMFCGLLDQGRYDIVHFQHLLDLPSKWARLARDSGSRVVVKLDDMFLYCARNHLLRSDHTVCEGPTSTDACLRCLATTESASTKAGLNGRRQRLQAFMAAANAVHTPSEYLREQHSIFGFRHPNFFVIRTGIEPFARSTQASHDHVRIGYVGMLSWRKGIVDFVDAVKLYMRSDTASNTRSRLQFTIDGSLEDNGPYSFSPGRLTESGNLVYNGAYFPRDRGRVFGALDLVVVPSRADHYPFVIREALFAGVPVATTVVGAIPEIIKHEKNGFLLQPADPGALAALFRRIGDARDLLSRQTAGYVPIARISGEAQQLSALFESMN